MLNKILFIVCTHSNEVEPRYALERIKESKGSDWCDKRFDVVVGNPLALELEKRYKDVDLNRNYPGDCASDKYEIKRDAELLSLAKKYSYVIDLHTTKSLCGIFTLVTKGTAQNIAFAKKLPLKNIVIWNSRPE